MAAYVGMGNLPKLAEQMAKNPGVALGDVYDTLSSASALAGQRMTAEDIRLARASVSQDRFLSATSARGQFDADTERRMRAVAISNPGMLLNAAARDRMATLSPEAFAENQVNQAMERNNRALERLAEVEGLILGVLRDLTPGGSAATQLARERGSVASAAMGAVAIPAATSPAAP
jgi:hypothetical protein